MPKQIDLTFAFDQATTTAENTAVMMATYYKRLMAEGVQPDLAERLTQDFNNLWWVKNLGLTPPTDTNL